MPSNKSLGRYLSEAFERNPSLRAGFDEALFETELAHQLAKMREARHMSQRELASRAGMVQPMLNRIERSNQIPTATTLWRLMCALDAMTQIGPSEVSVVPVQSEPFQAQVASGVMQSVPVISYGSTPLISPNRWLMPGMPSLRSSFYGENEFGLFPHAGPYTTFESPYAAYAGLYTLPAYGPESSTIPGVMVNTTLANLSASADLSAPITSGKQPIGARPFTPIGVNVSVLPPAA
jgi:DNA-binding XRE family transcriptional regulator